MESLQNSQNVLFFAAGIEQNFFWKRTAQFESFIFWKAEQKENLTGRLETSRYAGPKHTESKLVFLNELQVFMLDLDGQIEQSKGFAKDKYQGRY